MLSKIAIVALMIVASVISALWYGRRSWNNETHSLVASLDAARVPSGDARVDLREVDQLPPAPVQRYFKAALKDGQPVIRAVQLTHVGTFNSSEAAPSWRPFTSQQWVVTKRPGFVWDGRVAMAPGIAVHVHDAYVAGTGILRPTIAGLYTLMHLRGAGDIAAGELMRFFAEAAWYPTALLPSAGVQWTAIDDRSAQATLKDGPIELTLTFEFGADAMISAIRAEQRARMVGSSLVMTPWEVRVSDYRVYEGMHIPFSGEVAWLTPEGRRPYWRGTIATLRYEFVEAPRVEGRKSWTGEALSSEQVSS